MADVSDEDLDEAQAYADGGLAVGRKTVGRLVAALRADRPPADAALSHDLSHGTTRAAARQDAGT